MNNIPDAIYHLIVDKVKQGESQCKVSLQLNACLSTVSKIVMCYRVTESTDNIHRSCRPQKTTEKKEDFYVNFSKGTFYVSQTTTKVCQICQSNIAEISKKNSVC